MPKWYEHVCALAFLASAITTASVFWGGKPDNLSSTIFYVLIADGIFFFVGIAWMCAQSPGPWAAVLFLGTLLYLAVPLATGLSLVTATPLLATAGGGLLLITGGLLFSNILTATSKPLQHKATLVSAAVIYAAGWALSAYFILKEMRPQAEAESSKISSDTFKSVSIGPLVALGGALLGVVGFELARFDFERTAKSVEAPEKTPLLA